MFEGHYLIITAIILLSIASVGGILTSYLKIPYMSVLVIIGLAVGIFRIFPNLEITPSLIYYAFLPLIIFEGAVNIKIRPLKSNAVSIGILSVIGTIVSAALTATFMYLALKFPLKQSLIFGAVITPTDPVAILAMLNAKTGAFKKTGGQDLNAADYGAKTDKNEGMRTLLAGESLFNDGISLLLFEIFLGLNLSGAGEIFAGKGYPGIAGYLAALIGAGALKFLYEAIGGSVLGILLGYIVSQILSLTEDHMTEIMISVLLAYVSLIAAYYIHASFIMAIIFGGMVLANYGFKHKVSGKALAIFPVVLEYLTFLINSILFLIIGIEINLFTVINLWSVSLFIIAAVMFSRFISVYSLSPLISIVKRRLASIKTFADGEVPDKEYKKFLVFGGLRGALPIAMALSLPLDLPLRNELIAYVFIVVLFSLTIQAIIFDLFSRKLNAGKIEIPRAKV